MRTCGYRPSTTNKMNLSMILFMIIIIAKLGSRIFEWSWGLVFCVSVYLCACVWHCIFFPPAVIGEVTDCLAFTVACQAPLSQHKENTHRKRFQCVDLNIQESSCSHPTCSHCIKMSSFLKGLISICFK